jgi:hypothetical protein
MERRFPDSLKNHMTEYYLIPKKLRNLTPDATQSLSFAFDADLHCKGDFSVEIERWRLKAGDHPVHQNIHDVGRLKTVTVDIKRIHSVDIVPIGIKIYSLYILNKIFVYKKSSISV